MRAVVPAVLLGETAPVDNIDQAELTTDTMMPDASASDNGDAQPGKLILSQSLMHLLHSAIGSCRLEEGDSLWHTESCPHFAVKILMSAGPQTWCTCYLSILGAQSYFACAETATDAADSTAADTEALGGAKTKAAVDALLAQLPKCISRDLCDELSINFCYLNSKAARKRLVRTLCESSHRSNLQLLPFYCRVAAILSQVFPDVGAAVLKAQEDEFNHLQV